MTERRELFDYLTVKQFAAYKGVSVRTVRRWIAMKWIDAKRTADEHGQWRIKVPRAS
jgi:excisionase family DNA binding protein